jgi:ABC-type Fe3+ transport system permease subunit
MMRFALSSRRSDVLAWAVWLAYLAYLGVMLSSLIVASAGAGGAASRFLVLFTAPSVREALIRTHVVSGLSTGLVLVAGVGFLFSWRLRPIPGLNVLLRAPLLLHGFPAALAYLIVFGNAGWINRTLQWVFGLSQAPLPLAFTLQALILFFLLFGLPYFLAYTLHGIGPEVADLEDAARLLGAGPAEVFRRVTLPLLSGHLKAALSLVYILAAGSLSVPMVIGGARNSLLTAEIYGLVVTFSDMAGAAALSLGLIVSLVFPLILIDRVIAWGGSWISQVEFAAVRQTVAGACRRISGAGKGVRLLAQTACGYQRLWLILLAVLVLSPLYSSFVLDWGSGPLPSAWTLQWYRNITPQFWGSIRLSLLLSCGCVLISLLTGLPLALAWRFGSLPGRGLLKALVLLPIGIPGFLWGLSLLIIAYRWWPSFAQGPWILLVGQSFLALPFMVRVLMSALEQFDAEHLALGRILGAGPGGVVLRVLLPMILPSVGIGAVLVFVRTFGESNLALMVAPAAYPTAPLWLYEAIGISGIGTASVLEVFLVLVPLAALLAWEQWLRRRAPWAEVRAALPI